MAAKALAEQEHVDVRTYRVIYKAIEEVQAALVGMLEPEHVESELGTAQVRQVFQASKIRRSRERIMNLELPNLEGRVNHSLPPVQI